MILSTIEPGGGTGDEPYAHDSDEEVVIVLAGRLELWVADEHHVLEEGDCDHVLVAPAAPQRNRGDATGRRAVLRHAAELLSARRARLARRPARAD